MGRLLEIGRRGSNSVVGVYDAIVVAGGAARRLGGADKPAVEVDGTSLLDRAIGAARHAERVVVVGPPRPTQRPVIWAREDPPGGGPVAAIAVGVEHVEEFWCLVLAADLPWIGPAVPLLLTAASEHDVAVLTRTGQRNYLAAAWRTDALRAALDRLDHVAGASVRELFAGAAVTDVPDERGWGLDCDTWDDIEQARTKER